uniref:Uncharacterized protein n=1 Tax=Alexandrium monilatum TaxID=311494 RepID=A0A7S4VZU6_9DINO
MASGGALRRSLLEGLRLFGIPERAAACLATIQARRLRHQACRAELAGVGVPSGGGELPHPQAFLVGEAAGALSLRPGQELGGALRGAWSLAQQLITMQQCLHAKWPVSARMLSDHDQMMATLQVEERARCPERFVAPDGAESEERGAGSSDKEAFLAAVKDVHARLASGALPPEQLPELPAIDALCEKVSGSGLGADTYRLLVRTGSWLLGEQSGGAPEPLRGEVPDGAGGADVAESALDARRQQGGPSPRSQYNRGVRLLRGDGCKRSDGAAAEAFLRAAQRGHREAQYAIGVMFLHGRGVEQDQRQAVRWLMRAAEQNHAKAQYNMGLVRQYGIGLPRDLVAAAQWMSYAAEQGHRKALQSETLVTFGVGDWMDYDPNVIGADGVLGEARSGNRNAQYKMGAMLYDGDGVEQDKAEAAFWFMQAAQQGLAEAQYQMSRMLFFGDGVEQDEDYALRFLVLASEQGHMEAQHNLGVKLYFGENMGVDRQMAAHWFLQAAKQGLPQAQNNIGWMLVVGDGVQQNLREGRRWLEEAAGKGNIEAQMHINAIEGNVVGM